MKKKIILVILPIIIVLVVVYILYDKGNILRKSLRIPEQNNIVDKPPLVIKREYGFAIDSFEIIKGKLQRNQNLSLILPEYNVSFKKIDQIAKKSKGIFDIRKIKSGNRYTIFCKKDSLKTAQYFVYEDTPVDYIIFDLRDSVQVLKKKKEVVMVQKTGWGTITTSLWNTMKERNIDPIMAVELSEIYAWSIDFFGLQKGDMFKVIYDKHYIDSQLIRLGKIHAAWFKHMGNDFYAIPFVQDSVEAYFDQEGNSLRKAFLKAPLRFSRISSRFSYSRLHPILKIRRPHRGVDYAASVGTPVHTVGDGIVIKTSFTKEAGRMVKIKHNSVYTTAYLHLRSYARGIKTGVYVRQGDIIGYVGSTGLSTGPHLDFRFWKNGKAVDPLKIEAPPVDPIKEENRVKFNIVKNLFINKLAKINPY